MKKYVGIDLGGTNIVAAICDENFKILAKHSCSTNLPQTPQQIVQKMTNLVYELLEKVNLKLEDIYSIGLGVPGVVDYENKILINACNFRFENVSIANDLQNQLKIETYIENDANAAALGEFFYRKKFEPNLNSMVLLTLGTGIGGGIIINNKIYSGHNGCAAEIGHMVINMNGRQCNCGRKGCFEAYASATGLDITAKEQIIINNKSKLWNHINVENNKFSSKLIFDLAREGDEAALAARNLYFNHLAEGVANVVNIFQPQLVCLGGGISNAGDELLKPVVEQIMKVDYSKSISKRCRIEIGLLKNDAGLIGAAMLFKKDEI